MDQSRNLIKRFLLLYDDLTESGAKKEIELGEKGGMYDDRYKR
jgi:hypothetical protein